MVYERSKALWINPDFIKNAFCNTVARISHRIPSDKSWQSEVDTGAELILPDQLFIDSGEG